MRKLHFAFFLLLTISVTAQTKPDTLRGKAAQDVLDSLKIDNTTFLKSSRDAACKCIDKIKMKKKSEEKIAGEIKECIEKEVTSYQLMQKLMESMKAINSSKTITINTNKSTSDYSKYYYEIEYNFLHFLLQQNFQYS